MRPITNEDLESAFKRYYRAVNALAWPVDGLSFIKGSRTYGNSFKAVYVDPEHGGHSPAPGTYNGHLGMNKREAFDTLHAMARCFEEVAYRQSQ